MTVLGLDFDTRAVHAVLLDDDTDAARYVPIPFVEHKPPWRFEDARNVRPAVLDALRALGPDTIASLWLVGIEKPYSQNKDNAWKYGLIVGQILSCLPLSLRVLDMAPNDSVCGWKALSVGDTWASKDEVRRWVAQAVGLTNEEPNNWPHLHDWPQDAIDAFAIGWAARALNQRGIEANIANRT